MPVHACPVCGRAVDPDGEPFESVDAVLDHVEAAGGDHADFDAGDLRSAVERQRAVAFDGERPLAEALSTLDADLGKLRTKFDRVVQEQRNEVEGVQEVLERHMLAIQEMQAGLEALAEEHDKDVEYQYQL